MGRFWAVLVIAGLIGACRQPLNPTAPFRQPGPAPSPVPVAKLQIVNAYATLSPSEGRADHMFVHTLYFDLVETAGVAVSAIGIETWLGDEARQTVNIECGQGDPVVGPWDRIHVDAVACDPLVLRSRNETAAVSIAVTFVDYNGHAGRVEAVVPVVRQSAAASLAIKRPRIYLYPQRDGYFGYDVRFGLTETTGRSNATIQNVFVGDFAGGGDNTGPTCWIDPLRVPAGGSLDVFETDAGVRWLSYCAPASGGRSDNPELLIIVTFTDDNGRSDSTRATARMAR